MRKINTNLLTEIKGKGRLQKDVAKKAGMSESIMSMIVRGKYIPDNIQKARIAEVLKVNPREIFPDAN